jgi:hypothetical protein
MKHVVLIGKFMLFLLTQLAKAIGAFLAVLWFFSCVLLLGPAFVFDYFGFWWGLLYVSPWIVGALGALVGKYQQFVEDQEMESRHRDALAMIERIKANS